MQNKCNLCSFSVIPHTHYYSSRSIAFIEKQKIKVKLKDQGEKHILDWGVRGYFNSSYYISLIDHYFINEINRDQLILMVPTFIYCVSHFRSVTLNEMSPHLLDGKHPHVSTDNMSIGTTAA